MLVPSEEPLQCRHKQRTQPQCDMDVEFRMGVLSSLMSNLKHYTSKQLWCVLDPKTPTCIKPTDARNLLSLLNLTESLNTWQIKGGEWQKRKSLLYRVPRGNRGTDAYTQVCKSVYPLWRTTGQKIVKCLTHSLWLSNSSSGYLPLRNTHVRAQGGMDDDGHTVLLQTSKGLKIG